MSFAAYEYEPTEFTLENHDESFNSSQLTLEDRCSQAWVNQYVLGMPQRVTRGRTIGTLFHAGVEAHYDPEQSIYQPRYKQEALDDLHTLTGGHAARMQEILEHIPRMVEASVPFLPRREECKQLFVEHEFRGEYPVKSDLYAAGDSQVASRGTLDIECQMLDGAWLIVDHKSTAGGYREVPGKTRRVYDPWLYVPTPDELRENKQLLVYAYKIMQSRKVGIVRCRWVYNCSNPKKPAKAKPVEVVVGAVHVVARLRVLRDQALRMRDMIRRWKAGEPIPTTLYAEVKPPDPDSPCLMYRGCDYHVDQGGPCEVSGSLLQRIVAAPMKQPKPRKSLPVIGTNPVPPFQFAFPPQPAGAAAPAPVTPTPAPAPAPEQPPVPGGAIVNPTPAATASTAAPEVEKKHKRRPRKKKDETAEEFQVRLNEYEAERAAEAGIPAPAPAPAPDNKIAEECVMPAPAMPQPEAPAETSLSEFAWHELADELMTRGFVVGKRGE